MGFWVGHFKTQRKRIIMLQSNKWYTLVNEYTSGAPWRIVKESTTNHQETINAEQQWRPLANIGTTLQQLLAVVT